jgi:hypothetical protein
MRTEKKSKKLNKNIKYYNLANIFTNSCRKILDATNDCLSFQILIQNSRFMASKQSGAHIL